MTHFQFELMSGRRIGVTGLGDPISERLVLLCHPAPGGGVFDPDPIASDRSGLRIMGLDRPGYGASDPVPTDGIHPMELWLRDIDEYLGRVERGAREATGTEFSTIGAVGLGFGGYYAAALAAHSPQLVDRLVLVAVPRPREFSGTTRDPSLALGRGPHASGLADRRAAMFEDGASSTGRDIDRAALSIGGWRRRLAMVSARSLIVESDDSVGRSAARWFASRLGEATVELESATGIDLLQSAWGRVLRHLQTD